MSHDFRHSVRVLLCVGCGAPLELDPGAASASCTYCGAQNQVGPRIEDAVITAPAAASIDEPERRRRLARQVGKPLLPPPALLGLVGNGELMPWKVQEVFAVWQSTREEVRGSASFDAAERLLYLTMVLANAFAKEDRLKQRAMFESALAVSTLPRHRQTLRGYLSRAAARDGDLDDAAAWLTPCDQRSDDLDTDSAWRMSRAYLDTARMDWPAVVGLLGAPGDDVPVADSAAPMAVLLRANGIERNGDVSGAEEILRRAMSSGASARVTLDEIRRLHEDWDLCPASYGGAHRSHSAVAVRSAGASVGGGAGSAFYWIGLVLSLGSLAGLAVVVLTGGGAVLLGMVPLFVKMRSSQMHQLEGVAGGLGSVAFTVGIGLFTTLPMGVIFFAIGRGLRNAAKRAEYLRKHGVSAWGEVLRISNTGTEINDVPQVDITLRVMLGEEAPYEATARMLLPHHERARLMGKRVPIRVDPKQRGDVMIEVD